jgi:hypothetical protein
MCPIVAPSLLQFYKNLILHDELQRLHKGL